MMHWQAIGENLVLVPAHPRGIIHFLGGAFVATAPHITYRLLLESLAQQHFVVIATPFVNTLDHRAIAQTVLQHFEETRDRLRGGILRKQYLPVYGLGHSMGCKLHLLLGSLFQVERAGNILLSFNNFPVRRSIPFFDSIVTATELEFIPSPRETYRLIETNYGIQRNLLVRFTNDEIDQTQDLVSLLQQRFGNMVTAKRLAGNHLTPLGQAIDWQTGPIYSPLDAIGQWLKQEIYRDFNHLNQELALWLNPLALV